MQKAGGAVITSLVFGGLDGIVTTFAVLLGTHNRCFAAACLTFRSLQLPPHSSCPLRRC